MDNISCDLHFVSCKTMRLLLLICVIIPNLLFGQELQLEGTHAFEADRFIGVDSYQNTYFIKDEVLHKSGPLGDFVFNNYLLGSITSVDIINPLKVLVFYREVNTALFLDNRLNEIERIDFNLLPEFLNVGAAGNAGNNLLWVFDMDTQELELFDYRNNRKTIVSQPFNGELLALTSGFTYCHVLTSNGLFTFNVYGSFISERQEVALEQITQYGGDLIGLGNEGLVLIPGPNSDTLENTVVPLNLTDIEITVKDLHLSQDFLYIYDGNLLRTFTLTQPK